LANRIKFGLCVYVATDFGQTEAADLSWSVHPPGDVIGSWSVHWRISLLNRRHRLHRDHRELYPGTHRGTGANITFCPGTFRAYFDFWSESAI